MEDGRIEPGEDENFEIAVRLPVGDSAGEIEFAELHIVGEREAVTGIGAAGHYAGEELPTGEIRFAVEGRAPQGEQDARPVSDVLIRRLRQLGEGWGDPECRNLADVDCEATWEDRTLRIQVTKAEPDAAFWRSLRAGREGERIHISADTAADAIKSVVERKGRTDTTGTTLALSAMQTVALALPAVVRSFRRRHAAWAAGLGFEAVWIVGPHEAFTHRLDLEAPEER